MRSKLDLTHSMVSVRKELEGTLTSLFHGRAILQPRLALSWHERPTKPEASISSDLPRTRYLVILNCHSHNQTIILAVGKSPSLELQPSFSQESTDWLQQMGLSTTDIVGALYVEELTMLSTNYNAIRLDTLE